MIIVCFFFKQKTAYEMRISDWSSDVCSSDLCAVHISHPHGMSLGKSLTDLVCLPGRGRGGGAGTSSFPSVNLFVPPNTVTVCRGTDHVLVTVSIHIHGVHL